MSNEFATFGPGQSFGGASWIGAAGPGKRTDYWGPVNDKVMLMRSKASTALATPWIGLTLYDEPGRAQERWFVPGVAPTATDLGKAYGAQDPDNPVAFTYCGMCREGDYLWPIVSMGHADGKITDGAMRNGGAIRLYGAGGVEIPQTVVPNGWGQRAFKLPAEAGDYRMTREESDQRTTWNFRSSAPSKDSWLPGSPCLLRHASGSKDLCAQQPVLFVGYDFGGAVRLDNTVRAGSRHEFTVYAHHGATSGPMPKVAGLRVWTSTDDGATWRAAAVSRGQNGRYTVKADYPSLSRTKGAVSVKALAWDVDGNRVEQVHDRVFTLAAR